MSKILITCDDEGRMHLEVEGTKVELMKLIAELSRKLKSNTTLTEEDILFATRLGFKSDEDLKIENEKVMKEIHGKIRTILDEISNILREE